LVYLKKYRQFALISILILGFNTFAQNKKISLADKLEAMHMEILDLEIDHQSGRDIANISHEFTAISNELHQQKTLLERLKGTHIGWGSSEKLIFDANIKLRELQEKITLGNGWGELRLNIINFDNEETEEVKLKYDYGF
jgi:hypothetical protein